MILCICLNYGKPNWPWPRLVILTMNSVCWPWPRLVILDDIGFSFYIIVHVCVCVCVVCNYCMCMCTSFVSRIGLNWPRLVDNDLCVCVCVFGLGLDWFDNSLCACVCVLASVGHY